jgi:hypothetical protein
VPSRRSGIRIQQDYGVVMPNNCRAATLHILHILHILHSHSSPYRTNRRSCGCVECAGGAAIRTAAPLCSVWQAIGIMVHRTIGAGVFTDIPMGSFCVGERMEYTAGG